MKSDRRSFLKSAGITGISLSSLSFGMAAYPGQKASQADPGAAPQLEPLNRFPRMVQEYFTGRVRKIEEAGNERRRALRSKRDAEAYVRDVREKIQTCFGPWPEKTPLNARITGTLERDTYTIEKVIFESRPEFPVTANLYLPKGRNFPLPAVVGTCGHSDVGKAEPAYQSFAQGLALQGYIVLIYDPLGQGERIQYLTGENRSHYGIGVQEHLHAGNQLFLTGGSLSTWFAWDGIRAVDYLLTRPEVDPRHLGVTGNSGGGTQATWLCGVEPRFTMAAPSCFVTTFRHNMENELPADTEQCPRGALQLGLDHSDFIAAMAPKPVILLGQEKDFFDVRGLEESFARLKQLYRLLGAEENIQVFIGSGYHGYSQENREAMYNCFNRVTKNPEVKAEPALTLEKAETLWCTPRGQVGKSGARTVFTFTGQLSEALKKERKIKDDEELKQAVTKTLRLPSVRGVPDYRILRPSRERLYPKKQAATYAVETEPGIFAPVYRLDDNPLYSRPPQGTKRAILYVSDLSADDELRKEAFLKELSDAEP
ncbi:MAG: prolyl oligopeptidase family serine peptidase, partial [Mangrovibacterium sp.]|nr:prolyl oligopeptidase family serine peptidase [Mangrovibacterium sp.]